MGWRHFPKGVACPICGAKNNDWCSETDDRQPGDAQYFVRCMKSDVPPPGWKAIKSQAKQGGATFAQIDARESTDEERAAHRKHIEGESRKAKRKSQQQMLRARELFTEARELTAGDRAYEYLASRGLTLPGHERFPALRFDPACEYRPQPRALDALERRRKRKSRDGHGWPLDDQNQPLPKAFPALLCGVTDPNGKRISAVQRIFLNPRDGQFGRIPMLDAKKMLGSMEGGSVKFGRDGRDGVEVDKRPLILCEGVETALALWLATGWTVWACVSTAGLMTVYLPDTQRPERIVIAADHDAWDKKGNKYPGLEASLRCAERMEVFCKDVKIAMPPVPQSVQLGRGQGQTKSVDWLDLLDHPDFGCEAIDKLVRLEGKPRLQMSAENEPPPGVPAKPPPSERDDRYVGARRVWVKKNDPADQAEQMLRTPHPPTPGLTLIGKRNEPLVRRWAEGFWKHDGTRWRRAKEEKMRSIAQKFLRHTVCAMGKNKDGTWKYETYGSSVTKVASLLSHLAGIVDLGGIDDEPDTMPVFITPDGMIDEDRPAPSDCIAFTNGILDLDAWVHGKRVLYPPDPAWFSAACLPYDLPDEAQPGSTDAAWEKAPVYRKFIGQAFGEKTDRELDELHTGLEQIDTWHEWAGYCMVPDYTIQAICGIQGLPGTGKGTLMRLFTQLFGGDDQVGSTSLTDMGEKYGLEPLIGKLVVIDPDAETDWSPAGKEGASRLKKISGNDAVQVRRMGQPNIPSIRLPGRFTLVCNDVPRIPDAGGAFKRRLFWLCTPSPVPPDAVDRDLDAKLKDELPWVAVHALEGLARLRRRVATSGEAFVTPHAAEHVSEQFIEASSPLSAFVRDVLEKAPGGGATSKDEVYEAYRRWCESEKIGRPLAKSSFGRQLLLVAPWIEATRAGTGGREYLYAGVKVLSRWSEFGAEAGGDSTDV